jgi:hypothetical protein
MDRPADWPKKPYHTKKAGPMNPRSYRNLSKPVSTRLRCPVCHEEVYSRSNIHPQCAVRQSDPPRPKNKSKDAPSPDQVVDPLVEPPIAE